MAADLGFRFHASSLNASPADLPGFYFDPEKNRYFRLLPGHNNCNPLTREQLRAAEQERRRAALLLEDERAPRSGLNSTLLWHKGRLGLVPPGSYCRLVHEVKVSGMRRHALEVQSSESSSPNTDNFRLIAADASCERIFSVNDVSHGGCKYGIMNFSGGSKGALSMKMYDNLYFTNRKVRKRSKAHSVSLCLVGISQTPGCVSLLPASLFSNSNPGETAPPVLVPHVLLVIITPPSPSLEQSSQGCCALMHNSDFISELPQRLLMKSNLQPIKYYFVYLHLQHLHLHLQHLSDALIQSDLQSLFTGTVSLEQLRVRCLAQGHNGSKWGSNPGLLVHRRVCYPLGYYHPTIYICLCGC
uniref:Uncharacterized protein n=1 Tax=Denticeps clupeoides TaxID=299321 RepID=A0AAY4BML6_9TELE